MSTTKIALNNSARSTKFLSLPNRAFVLVLAFVFSLMCVAAAGADPVLENADRIDRNHGIDTADGNLEAGSFVLAQAGGDAGRSRPLEPRYQPREPEPESWYNGSYIFSLTRSVADSTIAPAGQVPLYVLTVPLDIAFLPFALIGGLFG